jgi:hypothetical protein
VVDIVVVGAIHSIAAAAALFDQVVQKHSY